MSDLSKYGPWAVIAGGSEGIGRSFALQLAQQGINLVLIARKPEPLQQTAEQVEALGVQAKCLTLDLTAPDKLARLRAVTDELDVGLLIYNAGAAGAPQHMVDRSLQSAMLSVQLNVVGQTELSHHFAGRMIERGSGGIVLVGSLGGSAGCAGLATYAASKAYTQIFAESLWAELSPKGVDVLALMIGRTRTPALARTEIHDNPDSPMAEPDDIANLGLDNLTHGPVCMPPELQQAVAALRAMPRDQAALLMSKGTG